MDYEILILGVTFLVLASGCILSIGEKGAGSSGSSAIIGSPNDAVDLSTRNSLPDLRLCNHTDSGWFCVLTSNGVQDDSRDYGIVEGRMRDKCIAQGGAWKCYGFCMPSYEHYCDFPYADVGVPCRNSSQCSGVCQIDTAYVDRVFENRSRYNPIQCDSCIGNCSGYKLRTCDWWYEINNGTIEDHTGILCD
jgi:hypothetical protein